MKKILAIAVVFISLSIWGQSVSMNTGGGGAIYLLKDSVKSNGGLVTASYVKDLGGKCVSYKESKRGPRISYCSQVWTSEFDCKKKLFRYRSSLTMSGEMGGGTVQAAEQFEPGTSRYGAEFTDVNKFKPDESTNVAFQLACQFSNVNR